MNRQRQVQELIYELLLTVEDTEQRSYGYVHLFGVSALAAMLAMHRGLDVELAGVAGLLHDIATYTSGSAHEHARRSAEQASQILGTAGVFAPGEVDAICTSIAHHSDKANTHDPFSELLKDADVLQHCLYSAVLIDAQVRLKRLEDVCRELSLSWPGEPGQ